jgi:hypothetical protein
VALAARVQTHAKPVSSSTKPQCGTPAIAAAAAVGEEHAKQLLISEATRLTFSGDAFAIATYPCMSKLLLLLLLVTTSVQHAANRAYDICKSADTGSTDGKRTSIQRLVGTAQARQLLAVGTSVCIAQASHTASVTAACKLLSYRDGVNSRKPPHQLVLH